MRILTLILIVLCYWLVPAPARAQHFPASAKEIQRLEKGKILAKVLDSKGHFKDIQSIGFLKHPPQAVWEAFIDFNHYTRIFSMLTASETRVNHRTEPQAYYRIRLPFPFGERWVVNRYSLDHQHYLMRWKRIDGSVKDYEGIVLIKPHKGGSLVLYQARIDPDLALPGWLLNMVQKQTLPAIIQDVGKWLDAH